MGGGGGVERVCDDCQAQPIHNIANNMSLSEQQMPFIRINTHYYNESPLQQ